MNEACTGWARLVDDEAIGEVLAASDRAFVHAHPETCDACRAEQDTWAALGAMVDGANELAAAPRHPEAHETSKIAALPERSPGPEGPLVAAPPPAARPRRTRFAGLAVALSVAAGLALVVSYGARSRHEAPPVALAPPAPPSATTATERDHPVSLSLTSGGAAEIDGREGRLGARIFKGSVLFARGGAACIVVDPSVRACLEKGSMVRVADTGAHRRLELLRGRIVAELDPQPAGASFGVTTREGSSVAIGTAFAVEVPEGDGPVATRVLHGVVLVKSEGGKEQRVGAHQGTTMGAATPRPSTNAEEERDRLLAAPLPALTESAAAEPVSFVSQTPGASAKIDDRIVGVTPLSLLLPPGAHAVVVHTSAAESRTTVNVVAAAHAGGSIRTIDVAAPALAAPAPSAPPPKPSTDAVVAVAPEVPVVPVAAEVPRAAELLTSARERRARGDIEGAVAAYRDLFARHPNATESHAALVPYGEIQLGKLGDAHGALGSFERYLVAGGPLAEEATFGKIRALRALGRKEDEAAAITAFLSAYPESSLATSLRARLEAPKRP